MGRLIRAPGDPACGTNGERGSGLGLLLCKSFIRKNNGAIYAESAPGKGTCFRVVLQKGNKKPV
ncbi:MAG: ATP-binding protein [Niabella sp.]